MSIDRHPDWYTVVRGHWKQTTGFLLASAEPCLSIRDQELESVGGRALASRSPKDLERWNPPRSWILAVIVCPGDSLQPVVDWVHRHRADPDRVWFFLHPRTDPAPLRSWLEAGHDTVHVDSVSNWQELHKLFGLALNDRVYADWKHLGD